MVPSPAEKIEQIHLFIEPRQKGMHKQEDLVLTINRIGDGEFLGLCGPHAKKTPDTPELGVWLKKSAHGRHLGREAVSHLARWAQENISFSYLLYPVDRDNIASRKIAEHLAGEIFRETTKISMSGNVLNEIAYKIMPVNASRA